MQPQSILYLGNWQTSDQGCLMLLEELYISKEVQLHIYLCLWSVRRVAARNLMCYQCSIFPMLDSELHWLSNNLYKEMISLGMNVCNCILFGCIKFVTMFDIRFVSDGKLNFLHAKGYCIHPLSVLHICCRAQNIYSKDYVCKMLT